MAPLRGQTGRVARPARRSRYRGALTAAGAWLAKDAWITVNSGFNPPRCSVRAVQQVGVLFGFEAILIQCSVLAEVQLGVGIPCLPVTGLFIAGLFRRVLLVRTFQCAAPRFALRISIGRWPTNTG